MKQLYSTAILITGFFLSPELTAQQKCASHEAVKQQIEVKPGYARKIQENKKSLANYQRGDLRPNERRASITIPVVVHIVYNTPDQNISDAQVQSQIDVLNEDLSATNNDYNNYNADYGAVRGDADYKFCLDQIVRKQTNKRFFGVNDGMKKSRQGGSEAVDPLHKLNIWVCNLQSYLGYAYLPGAPAEIFGVVCHYRAFGRGENYNLFPEYNLGRTTTHEVGHCFGLEHIWGDSNCGNDFVDDTPLHNTANFGCPPQGHLSTCTGNPLEMWMNYMDYTDDRCMYFFSDGQVSRMDFFIDNDALINSIVNSACIDDPGNNKLITSTNIKQGSTNRTGNTGFQIYPTVASGKITLEMYSAIAGNADVNIYNQSGALVMKKKMFLEEGAITMDLDIARLTNGIYFLQLNRGIEKKTKKFIIQQ